VHWECALDADAVAQFTNGIGLLNTRTVTTNDIALENLDSLFAALHNAHMNLEFISGSEHWDVSADVL
jgi:hypothetical protein